MLDKPKKKPSVLVYVGGSVILVVATVAFTAIINRAKPDSSTDIRAKAGVLSTLKLTGTVGAVNIANNNFTVAQLRFHNQNGESIETTLGTWTVTPPPAFTLSSLTPGKEIVITADASTFMVDAHTVKATAISAR